MTYVLVSLPGDEATQAADLFAQWLAGTPPLPHAAFHDPAVAHEDVARGVEQTGRAVICSHNGFHDGVHSLRSQATGAPWATAEQIARVFLGARLYAYACETMGRAGKVYLDALGHEAHRLGVAAFAGHAVFFDGGWDQNVLAENVESVRAAVAKVIHAFLDGEDDANKLKLLAWESFDILDTGIVLDDPAVPSAFVVPFALHIAFEHLVVAAGAPPGAVISPG
jgi:hypothetical protein